MDQNKHLLKKIAELASFLTKRGGWLGNDEGKKKEQIFLGIRLHTEEQQKFKTGLADKDKKKTISNGSFPEIYTVNKLGILVHSVQGKGLQGEVRWRKTVCEPYIPKRKSNSMLLRVCTHLLTSRFGSRLQETKHR